MSHDAIQYGAAMAVLVSYAEQHECVVWLELNPRLDRWRGRIVHHGTYDGCADSGDPLEAATRAVVNARLAAERKREVEHESKE